MFQAWPAAASGCSLPFESCRWVHCHGRGVHITQVPWQGPQRQGGWGVHREPPAAKSHSPWAGVPSHHPPSAPVQGLPASSLPCWLVLRPSSSRKLIPQPPWPGGQHVLWTLPADPSELQRATAHTSRRDSARSLSLGSQHNCHLRLVSGRRRELTPRYIHGLWGHQGLGQPGPKQDGAGSRGPFRQPAWPRDFTAARWPVPTFHISHPSLRIKGVGAAPMKDERQTPQAEEMPDLPSSRCLVPRGLRSMPDPPCHLGPRYSPCWGVLSLWGVNSVRAWPPPSKAPAPPPDHHPSWSPRKQLPGQHTHMHTCTHIGTRVHTP